MCWNLNKALVVGIFAQVVKTPPFRISLNFVTVKMRMRTQLMCCSPC